MTVWYGLLRSSLAHSIFSTAFKNGLPKQLAGCVRSEETRGINGQHRALLLHQGQPGRGGQGRDGHWHFMFELVVQAISCNCLAIQQLI